MTRPESRPNLSSIPRYKGGRFKHDANKNPIRLSSNENPFGCSSRVRAMLQTEPPQAHRYQRPTSGDLKRDLAKFHDLNEEQLIIGCGSNEILQLAVMAYLREGDEAIITKHGFLMYSIMTKRAAGNAIIADEVDYKTSISSILDAVTEKTRMLFLANPSNPLGTFLTHDEVEELLDKLDKRILVVLDCAYHEYAIIEEGYPDGLLFAKRYPNVLVTRTFSKAYGLAGLRIGWGFASPHVVAEMERVLSPFNVSVVAEEAALLALQDQDFLKTSVESNRACRERFVQDKGIPYTRLPSVCNFVLMDCGYEQEAKELNHFLSARGILVREMSSYQLPSCLRISIGTPDETDTLQSAIKSFVDHKHR